MSRILVLFGTTDGHTASVAGAIRDALPGNVVVAQPHRLDPSPDGFDAVVVAASVHGGRFQRRVTKWVTAHADRLNRMPTAFVSVSLGILQRDAAVQKEVAAIVERFCVQTRWQPEERLGIAGALLYTKYWWPKRWVMRRIAGAAGGDTDTSRDYVYTNWEHLRTFARNFGSRLTGPDQVPLRPEDSGNTNDGFRWRQPADDSRLSTAVASRTPSATAAYTIRLLRPLNVPGEPLHGPVLW